MGRFALILSDEGGFSAFSTNEGMQKTAIIIVVQEWLKTYRDNFRNSLTINFIDDDGNSEDST